MFYRQFDLETYWKLELLMGLVMNLWLGSFSVQGKILPENSLDLLLVTIILKL